MKLKNKDFVEIDFTATADDGKVFDTTSAEVAKKENLPESKYEPVKVCIGEGHVLKGVDKELVGREVGQEFEIEIQPEDAFGKRKADLIKIIPLKIFKEKEVNPFPGLPIAIDNQVAIVRAVSGGRVITDFNHPMAGKKVNYKVKILKKIENKEEQAGIITEKYFRTNKFSVKGKEISLEEHFHEIIAKQVEGKIKELVGDFTIKQKGQGEKEEKPKSSEKKKV